MRSALTLRILPAFALSAAMIAAPAPVLAAEPSGQVEISALLAELETAADSTATYDRDLFKHWVDADGDGCDTREEVLIAESVTPVVKDASCTITSGKWESWYDGATWTAPGDVDIDHLVALGEAWKSGAADWTADRREAYANDLGLDTHLEAVTDNVNQSKGDRDPTVWMPPVASVDCRYATDWVLAKYRWDLTVDAAEIAKLNDVISGTCAATVVTVPTKG